MNDYTDKLQAARSDLLNAYLTSESEEVMRMAEDRVQELKEQMSLSERSGRHWVAESWVAESSRWQG